MTTAPAAISSDHAAPRRRFARRVDVGGVMLGGESPVAVQTMTNADPLDDSAVLEQVRRAARQGAAIVRVAVPTLRHIDAFARVAAASPVPVVADIHYDARVAAAAIERGAAKVRINPGNMGDWNGLARVAAAARRHGAAIRLGLNSGSIPPPAAGDLRPPAERLADTALEYARRFEDMGVQALVLSLKTPDPAGTVAANRLVAARCDYPLHLGLTHAGLREDALLASAVALGALLLDGIGDTIRLSFSGPPEEEVDAGLELLRAAGLLRDRPRLLACPTCGRAHADVAALAAAVRARLGEIRAPLTLAVMGCEVNGPGEAKAADAGLAATGGGKAALFVRGEVVGRYAPAEAVDRLLSAARALADGEAEKHNP